MISACLLDIRAPVEKVNQASENTPNSLNIMMIMLIIYFRYKIHHARPEGH